MLVAVYVYMYACIYSIQGIDVIFKVALAIIQLSADSLLALDMEGIVMVSVVVCNGWCDWFDHMCNH